MPYVLAPLRRAAGKFERADDWSAVAYFYLDRPENGPPAMAPVAERVAGPEERR